jgi:hypothetical protein
MSDSADNTVFVLGAGCSANCGYPLGKRLVTQLQEFLPSVPERCQRIRSSLDNTIRLAQGLPNLDTLDQLAKHIEAELRCWTSGSSSDYAEKEAIADRQIRDAKIAVAAMFLANEALARRDLRSYERFVAGVFGGEPWSEGIAAAECRVLSFNYDRLFEISFLSHFKSFNPTRNLYAKDALNAGFNDRRLEGFDKVAPEPNRFSFLKLHGSAGWWVKRWRGNRDRDECRLYWPCMPGPAVDLHEIEEMLNRRDAYPWEPLIVFPHERQREIADFPHDPYREKIWAHAKALVRQAEMDPKIRTRD